MATNLYWRVNIASVGTVVRPALAELEFRTSPGGANAATGGTAIASSDFGSTWVPAHAYDANTATGWSASGFSAEWIGYQFPLAVDIVQIAITARSDAPGTTPLSFSVEWSDDGSTWTAAWDETTLSWSAGETRVFTMPTQLQATKSEAYGVLGPPLLISSTKSVMYVITGPGVTTHPQRITVALVARGRAAA